MSNIPVALLEFVLDPLTLSLVSASSETYCFLGVHTNS